jgi:hypothetical protein
MPECQPLTKITNKGSLGSDSHCLNKVITKKLSLMNKKTKEAVKLNINLLQRSFPDIFL